MKQENKNEFVWYGLRTSFWIAISIWVIFTIVQPESYFEKPLTATLSLLWLITIFSTFIISIIHLTKFKERAFAITALVISSYLIFTLLVGFIIGMASVIG